MEKLSVQYLQNVTAAGRRKSVWEQMIVVGIRWLPAKQVNSYATTVSTPEEGNTPTLF